MVQIPTKSTRFAINRSFGEILNIFQCCKIKRIIRMVERKNKNLKMIRIHFV